MDRRTLLALTAAALTLRESTAALAQTEVMPGVNVGQRHQNFRYSRWRLPC